MDNFKAKSIFGNHLILSIDTEKHQFIEYFKELYDCQDLSNIHIMSSDYKKNIDKIKENSLFDTDTDLHGIFYNDIKNNEKFKKLYCNLVKDIYENLFPEERVFIYQAFPSIRIQYFDSITIPPHYDADDLGKHPIGEKNFIIPITEMYGTNSMFIESQPKKKDFKGIELKYGDLLYFNGNKCVHYNMKNIESKTRISLDFRIILFQDYINYIKNSNVTYTNPRDIKRTSVKMTIGGYYQITFKNELDTMLNWYQNSKMILQSRPNFDMNEANSVYDYMSNFDNFFTEYKKTLELEQIIANYIGTKFCVMVNNGTVSLMLALYALDIKNGDEVIVPNYTMIATINAIRAIGATPIITDVDKHTFTLTKEIIERHLTTKCKAVIHVSLNNRTKNLQEITDFCKKKNVYLIEDAAQSLGCFLNNKHIGTFGIIGSFSLSTPKIISTGQGGFLVTDDESIYKKICMMKNFGRKEGGIDDFEVFGLNFKFTDIQAIIGIEQMKKLDFRVKRMREIFDLYYEQLSDIVIIQHAENDSWIPWFIEIIIDDREELINFLKAHNVQTRKTYPLINKTTMYFNDMKYPNSEYISEKGLFLPSHTLLTDDDIQYICKIIKLWYLKKNILFLTLTCYSQTKILSPWYIHGENSGMGNMLFQLSSGLYYAHKNNAELFVPSLNTFLTSEKLEKKETIFRKINTELLQDYDENKIRKSHGNHENIFSHEFTNKMNLHNYFENIDNFDQYREKILYYFRPLPSEVKYIINKYPIIQNENLASIHVRKGADYNTINTKEKLAFYESCYFQLIDYMIENKGITNFFVFTNDKNYCNSIFTYNQKYSNITFYYSEERDFYDIWMISLIKNNILSISTLAWWGSYLNENENQFVLGHSSMSTIINPRWLYI